MKYLLFVAALSTMLLVGCGPKPEHEQKPPSLYVDEDGQRMGAEAGKE